MLHDVVVVGRSHVDHKRRIAWVSISTHAFDPVPIAMVRCKK